MHQEAGDLTVFSLLSSLLWDYAQAAISQDLTLSREKVQLKLCLFSTLEYKDLKASNLASKRNRHRGQILEKKIALSSFCCSFLCKMKVTFTLPYQALQDCLIRSTT